VSFCIFNDIYEAATMLRKKTSTPTPTPLEFKDVLEQFFKHVFLCSPPLPHSSVVSELYTTRVASCRKASEKAKKKARKTNSLKNTVKLEGGWGRGGNVSADVYLFYISI